MSPRTWLYCSVTVGSTATFAVAWHVMSHKMTRGIVHAVPRTVYEARRPDEFGSIPNIAHPTSEHEGGRSATLYPTVQPRTHHTEILKNLHSSSQACQSCLSCPVTLNHCSPLKPRAPEDDIAGNRGSDPGGSEISAARSMSHMPDPTELDRTCAICAVPID